MSHHVLMEFIRKAKQAGVEDEKISERLYQAGWYRVDIQDALGLYRSLTTATASLASAMVPPERTVRPPLGERLAPKSYDHHIVAVAALSFAIGFVLYLLIVR